MTLNVPPPLRRQPTVILRARPLVLWNKKEKIKVWLWRQLFGVFDKNPACFYYYALAILLVCISVPSVSEQLVSVAVDQTH